MARKMLPALVGADHAERRKQGHSNLSCKLIFRRRRVVGANPKALKAARPQDRAVGDVEQAKADIGRAIIPILSGADELIVGRRGRRRTACAGAAPVDGDIHGFEAGKSRPQLVDQGNSAGSRGILAPQELRRLDEQRRHAVAGAQWAVQAGRRHDRPGAAWRIVPAAQRDDRRDHDTNGRQRGQRNQYQPVVQQTAQNIRRGGRRTCAGFIVDTPPDRRHVAAACHLEHDRIGRARPGVVALERTAQPRRLDAHDRVDLRIEILRPPERFHPDGVAFDAAALAAQGRLHDEAQECGELRRGAEGLAREQAIEGHARGGRVLVRNELSGSHCVRFC